EPFGLANGGARLPGDRDLGRARPVGHDAGHDDAGQGQHEGDREGHQEGLLADLSGDLTFGDEPGRAGERHCGRCGTHWTVSLMSDVVIGVWTRASSGCAFASSATTSRKISPRLGRTGRNELTVPRAMASWRTCWVTSSSASKSTDPPSNSTTRTPATSRT